MLNNILIDAIPSEDMMNKYCVTATLGDEPQKIATEVGVELTMDLKKQVSGAPFHYTVLFCNGAPIN
jgi:hypothetical protein